MWSVIQQGMNSDTNYARRYHWLSEHVNDFIYEPHDAILGEKQQTMILDMTSKESVNTQKTNVDLVNDNPRHLMEDWAFLTRAKGQGTLDKWIFPNKTRKPVKCLNMARSINWNKMKEIYDFQPKNYEQLI